MVLYGDNFMKMEVLISTYNKNDVSFTEKMNLQSDVVIGNQIKKNKKISLKKNFGDIKIICSNTRGVAYNRNITLDNSSAEICLLGDDDLVYVNNYPSIIVNRFKENPDVDVIVFNLYEPIKKRFIIRKKFRVNHLNYMRFGAVRIAFKRKSILDNKIRFDVRFGPGGEIPIGEDTIFLRDCLASGLKILAVPDYILSLTEERESTWFKGYTENYFLNKGKLFKRLYPRIWPLICMQDLIRHCKLYGIKNIHKDYKMMVLGACRFKQ